MESSSSVADFGTWAAIALMEKRLGVFMSRRSIAKGTLISLLIAGFILLALGIAGHIAENVAEKKAIAAFEKLGGSVTSVEKNPDLPKWIAWIWPASTAVHGLNLNATKVTSEGLKELASLKNLRALYLAWTEVTDAGLEELEGFKSLEVLDLRDTKVTDSGIKELANLKNLQVLRLTGTRVTDAGVKELAGLKSLQTLYLDGTQVTDAGLKELAGFRSLRTLGLATTQVTDAGMAELRKALPECDVRR